MSNMSGVIPYLRAPDAARAIDFYKAAFGAVEVSRMPTDDGRVMHCHLEINGGALMLSDAFPEHGAPFEGFKGVMMTLAVPDGQAWWNRAIAAGCTVVMPFELQFWGDRYGHMTDPFGVTWAINESKA